LLKNVGFDEVSVLPTGVQTDRAVMVCRKRAPYPDSCAISYLGSTVSLVSGPAQSHPGEVLTFRVRAENSGYARWLRGSEKGAERGDVHLVAHLLGEDEEPLSLYYAGAFLPHDIAPGETIEIEISVRAPDSPGHYQLAFDMVSEHLAWFEDLGSVVAKQQLIVK
jgi:hypothetical protein